MSQQKILCLSLLLLVLSGCGSPGTQSLVREGQSNIYVSPSSAVVGSSSFDLTVTGDHFAGQGLCAGCVNSVVVWTTDSGIDRLATTFVNSSELKAAISADLLSSIASAKITVETWAEGAETPQSITKPAIFSVKEALAGAPVISAVTPASAPAGSSDITITITGSNFLNTSFMNSSVAFWTSDPNNLHDHGTMLSTSFVSDGQLSVLIPAGLLVNSTSMQIVVLNGDSMGMSDGYFGYPESNSVTFTVTP